MEHLPNYDVSITPDNPNGDYHHHSCEYCDRGHDDEVVWFADVGEYLCPEHRKAVEKEWEMESLESDRQQERGE